MKRIISALIVIMIILSLTTISKAAEVSVSLNPEKEKVEAGTEIKVSLIVNNFTRTGTQKAIEAKVEYDNTKLEYKSVSWNNGWTGNISTDRTGMTATKSSEVKESEVIAEITYLVKAEAEEGKAEIKASQIITSAEGDEVEASDTKTEIEIVKKAAIEPPVEPPVTEKELSGIEIIKAPTKTTYTEGEKFDKTGMVVLAKYSDGSSKEITNYTYTPEGNLKLTDTTITISYTEGEITKTIERKITIGKKDNKPASNGAAGTNKTDNSVAGKDYPKTGSEKLIVPAIVIALIGTVGYIGYRKNDVQ